MNPANPTALSKHVASVGDIAVKYGVDRRLAHYWTTTADFPKPYDTLRSGAVWKWGPVDKWAEKHGHKPVNGDGDGRSTAGDPG